MSKQSYDGSMRKNQKQKKLSGQADISNADHTVPVENQNQEHNTKKTSLGPNTRR